MPNLFPYSNCFVNILFLPQVPWKVLKSLYPMLAYLTLRRKSAGYNLCLLNICDGYAADHEITFNCKKTIGVPFFPKMYKLPAP